MVVGRLRGALLLVMTLMLLLPALPAQAVQCYIIPPERNTFIRRTGSNLYVSRGVLGRMMVRDNSLGSCLFISGFIAKHDTVHMRRGTGLADAVEIGWRKQQRSDQPAPYWVGFVHYFKNFDETQVYVEFGSNCLLNGQLTPGHTARFKLYLKTSNGAWTFWYDDDNNGTYCQVGGSGFAISASFSIGLASAETGVFGGDDTNAYSHHHNLNYSSVGDNQGWALWPGNTWWQNCIPGWGNRWIAPDEYELLQGNPCPP